MANYGTVIFFSLIGGLFSLVGGWLLISQKQSAKFLARLATPFAAGGLLAAAFFELLPEAIHLTAEDTAAHWVLAGIVIFFLLEHFLHWFHHHHEHHEQPPRTTATLIIIGDSVHNFLDGVAIGAAFLISAPVGIVTAIAVAAHEIPQEIGDFGLLLSAGIEKNKVISINIASAFMSTIGALLTFWLGTQTSLPLGELLAITAGFFIYIAASDLIPSIHEDAKGKAAYMPAALLIAGILTVGATTEVAHRYIESDRTKNGGGVCIVGVESPCNSSSNSQEQEGDAGSHGD